MCHNCFLIKVEFKLTWNQGKIHELPWNDDCFENESQLFFLIKVDLKLTWNQGKIRELPWNDDCFENGSQLFVIFNQGWSQVDLQSR